MKKYSAKKRLYYFSIFWSIVVFFRCKKIPYPELYLPLFNSIREEYLRAVFFVTAEEHSLSSMISKAIVPPSRHILALFIESPDTSVKVLEKSLVKNGLNLTTLYFLNKENNVKEGTTLKCKIEQNIIFSRYLKRCFCASLHIGEPVSA